MTPEQASPASAVSITPDLSRRDIRQRDLLPPDRLAETDTIVIGVGAIGRQVALQLAAIGVRRMTLVDDDIVSVENLAAQGYWPADLGRLKVEATAAICRSIHPSIELSIASHRFGRSSPRRLGLVDSARPLAVFCCVDSIATRKLIWETVREHAALWLDARMAAETIRVLAADAPRRDERYVRTLFDASEAHAGSCTTKSAIYAASIAAGLMLAQFSRWLRQIPMEPDQMLNLLAAELSVAG